MGEEIRSFPFVGPQHLVEFFWKKVVCCVFLHDGSHFVLFQSILHILQCTECTERMDPPEPGDVLEGMAQGHYRHIEDFPNLEDVNFILVATLVQFIFTPRIP